MTPAGFSVSLDETSPPVTVHGPADVRREMALSQFGDFSDIIGLSHESSGRGRRECPANARGAGHHSDVAGEDRPTRCAGRVSRRAAHSGWTEADRAGGPAHGLLQAEQAARRRVPGTGAQSTLFARLGRQAAESGHGGPHADLRRTRGPIAERNPCWASTNRRPNKPGRNRGCGRS